MKTKVKTRPIVFVSLVGIFFNCSVFAQTQDTLSKTVIKQDKGIESLYLRSVEGAAIFDGKKTDLILLDQLTAAKATNNARQIFAQVPGITVWESDGAGIQMGIGTRGLSPKRSAEFNMRQNGYDMSADALGYPESYFTPPIEAVDKVQIVRGAASLQYGSQFGGMVNFVTRNPRDQKGLRIRTMQTYGSWNLFNSYNEILYSDSSYSAQGYAHYKQGDDQRKYSEFTQKGAMTGLGWHHKNFSVKLEYTHMDYLAQQPGGLTDAQFKEDPLHSLRKRNWFAVNWNLLALISEYKANDQNTLENRFFGLLASRKALGNLTPPNRTDANEKRTLLVDNYLNGGWETRWLNRHFIGGEYAALVVGTRLYQGNLDRDQGLGSDADDDDFSFDTPLDKEGSSFKFPSTNFALFSEYMIPLSNSIRLTPGFRYEIIHTEAHGAYAQQIKHPLTQEILYTDSGWDDKESTRHFPLFGAGISWFAHAGFEVFGNFSQNYRGINFNDMRVNNPNIRVDNNLKDESGFTADLGIRGKISSWIRYDIGGFWLEYQDRIGQILQLDSTNYQFFRYRTNLANSRHLGSEGYFEIRLSELWKSSTTEPSLSGFFNYTLLEANYFDAKRPEIENKQVELVPQWQWRAGLKFKYEAFDLSLLYSYTGEQFTDATNAKQTSDGVNGLIPSFGVLDLTSKYQYKVFEISSGVNNLLNEIYFSRRSDGYPGPGIITAPSRNFFVTLGMLF